MFSMCFYNKKKLKIKCVFLFSFFFTFEKRKQFLKVGIKYALKLFSDWFIYLFICCHFEICLMVLRHLKKKNNFFCYHNLQTGQQNEALKMLI